MTGSIQEKHGKFYAVLCYKDVLGKPQRKWVPTNLEVRGNKKRAESMLPGIIEEYLYLEPKECKSVLFVDYIREWLIRKKADVQQSTWEGYEIYVTRHIMPQTRIPNTCAQNVRQIPLNLITDSSSTLRWT